MSIEIKLPDLGDGIESGTVSSVFVKEGDVVEREQALLELETDKAVIEVPSDSAGTVSKVLVGNGDEVKIGQVMFVLDSANGGGQAPASPVEEKAAPAEEKKEASVPEPPAPKKAATETVVSLVVPNMGDGVESGTVSSVFVKPGDVIEKEASLVELETDKAVIEIPAEAAGTVEKVLVSEGDTLSVGQEICTVKTGDAVAEEQAHSPESASSLAMEQSDVSHLDHEAIKQREREAMAVKPRGQKRDPSKIAPASPSVRRFAREIGIDIHQVPGTGPGGRISVEDVKAYSKMLNSQGRPASGVVSAEPLPDFSKYGPVETEALNKLRQTSARHLSQAWSTIPHVTQFDKADITALEKMRKANGKKAEAAGGKLTMTAILIKVVEAALRKFPEFNASIDMTKNEIIYKKYYNIGIAVDTDRGLLVPVIKNVDQKNIIDLAVELTEISQKARAKKLTMDDMQGGNFSISNLGGIGGTGFTPIVNAPDVAILGVSRSEIQPKYIDGAFQPRLMMPLALSYDHRIIDGAAAARFLRWICQVLEEPFTVLLEG